MIDPGSSGFVLHFFRAYPARTAGLVVLLAAAGLAEGVGVVTLLPVLELAAGTRADSLLSRLVAGLLDTMGVEPRLGALLLLIVVAMAVKGLFRWLAMRQVGFTVARVGRELRMALVRGLMGARWGWFARQHAGHLAAAVSREALWSSYAYRHACVALAGAIQVTVYAAIVVLLSWQIALVALLLGTLLAVLFGGLVGMSRRAGRDQTERARVLVGRFADVVQGIKPIKAMGREEEFLGLLEDDTRRLEETERRQILASETLQSLQAPAVAAVIAGGLYAGLTWGDALLAELLLMAFLFYRIVGRIQQMQVDYQSMAAAESAFWSLHRQTRSAEEEREGPFGGAEPPPLEDALELEAVSFTHGTVPVLREVSARIPAGSFAMIRGPSGAGKTTLVDLVVGLRRPDSGEVLVDGVPLGALDLARWRRRIGYVPQETVLLHDTVVRNVTLGRAGVSRQEVMRALEDAGARTFVEALPEGLDTVVGERGARLSGGERQRIALARALLGRPSLLVLDEPTTGVDAPTEARIFATLRDLAGRVTILCVAHHSAAAGVADVVFELRDGRAVGPVPVA